MEEIQIDKTTGLIRQSAEAGICILTAAKNKNANMRLVHLWQDQVSHFLRILTTEE